MKGKGCTRVGVCGKTPEVAALQDLLIHTLKGLSIASVAGRKVNISDKETNRFTCMAMFSTLTNVEFDPYRFEDLLFQSVSLRDKMIQRVTAAGGKVETTSDAVTLKLKPTLDGMVKQAKNYGLMSDPDVNPDIRSLQHMLLFGIKGIPRLLDVGMPILQSSLPWPLPRPLIPMSTGCPCHLSSPGMNKKQLPCC